MTLSNNVALENQWIFHVDFFTQFFILMLIHVPNLFDMAFSRYPHQCDKSLRFAVDKDR